MVSRSAEEIKDYLLKNKPKVFHVTQKEWDNLMDVYGEILTFNPKPKPPKRVIEKYTRINIFSHESKEKYEFLDKDAGYLKELERWEERKKNILEGKFKFLGSEIKRLES